MIEQTGSPPRWQQAQTGTGRITLSGRWTLDHAAAMSEQLRAIPEETALVDAGDIERLDSAGVMQLMRFAKRRGLDAEHLRFREEHVPLVQVIEDVADDRPRRRRDYRPSTQRSGPGFDCLCRPRLARWMRHCRAGRSHQEHRSCRATRRGRQALTAPAGPPLARLGFENRKESAAAAPSRLPGPLPGQC